MEAGELLTHAELMDSCQNKGNEVRSSNDHAHVEHMFLIWLSMAFSQSYTLTTTLKLAFAP